MRITRHPAPRKARFTRRSRAMFPASFFRQNDRLDLGWVACLGQPCQKQPSTKSARRTSLNTKSGRTENCGVRNAECGFFPEAFFTRKSSLVNRKWVCLLHPLIPSARSNLASTSSVLHKRHRRATSARGQSHQTLGRISGRTP